MKTMGSAWRATRSTAPGPSLSTKSDRVSQRTSLPTRTASMKFATRISKTPDAKTKTFQGHGGGIMEGIMTARNSWR
jgi:hypothetical protein